MIGATGANTPLKSYSAPCARPAATAPATRVPPWWISTSPVTATVTDAGCVDVALVGGALVVSDPPEDGAAALLPVTTARQPTTSTAGTAGQPRRLYLTREHLTREHLTREHL